MKPLFIAAAAIALSACSGMSAKEENAKAEFSITNTVSFRLDCDSEKISFTCLNENDHTGACDEYGVMACQEKSVYSKVGTSWIMTASKPL